MLNKSLTEDIEIKKNTLFQFSLLMFEETLLTRSEKLLQAS